MPNTKTPTKNKEEIDASNQVLIYLRKITRAIDLHSRKLIQECNLTGPQLIILKGIDGAKQITIGELARSVSLSNATVTGIVSRLETRGFVERLRNKTDRRQVIVKKTKKADKILESAPSLLQEQFVSLFNKLAKNERDQILESLQKVGFMMGAKDLDAAPLLANFPPAANEETVGSKLIEEAEKEDNDMAAPEANTDCTPKNKTPENLKIHVIESANDIPGWSDPDSLALFVYENIKPYEDTLEDTKRAVRIAIDPDMPQGSFIILAEIDQKPVGALIMHRTGMKGYIPENILLMVCVHPSMRGKGVGGKIIKKGLEQASGDVKLHVEYENPAKGVYEKIGFTSKYAELRYYK